MIVTVIGRGHSGTRAMSHTLTASGFYMGSELNGAGDLLPPEAMYEACRLIARQVTYTGDLRWDFSRLHSGRIDPAFERLIETYLASVLRSDAPLKGWKIPETTLVYPWLVRLYPEIRYIYWVRDPRDAIAGRHLTDDTVRFGIPHEPTDDERRRRAISWKYQSAIFQATPPPRHLITVRLEDFVLRQDVTLQRLEAFLGVPLAKIPVKPEVIGRWRKDPEHHDFDFLADEMKRHEYV
jgi:hypothetical protein